MSAEARCSSIRPVSAARPLSPLTALACGQALRCRFLWTGTRWTMFHPPTSRYSPVCVCSETTTRGQPECRRHSSSAPSCLLRAEPSRSVASRPCMRASAGRSPGGVLLDSIIDERRKPRLACAQLLEFDRAREHVEQTLAAAQDEWRDDDRQVVDQSSLEELPDDVRAAHDVHRLLAGGRARTCRRIGDAADKGEAVSRRLVLGPVRDDEEG